MEISESSFLPLSFFFSSFFFYHCLYASRFWRAACRHIFSSQFCIWSPASGQPWGQFFRAVEILSLWLLSLDNKYHTLNNLLTWAFLQGTQKGCTCEHRFSPNFVVLKLESTNEASLTDTTFKRLSCKAGFFFKRLQFSRKARARTQLKVRCKFVFNHRDFFF